MTVCIHQHKHRLHYAPCFNRFGIIHRHGQESQGTSGSRNTQSACDLCWLRPMKASSKPSANKMSSLNCSKCSSKKSCIAVILIIYSCLSVSISALDCVHQSIPRSPDICRPTGQRVTPLSTSTQFLIISVPPHNFDSIFPQSLLGVHASILRSLEPKSPALSLCSQLTHAPC